MSFFKSEITYLGHMVSEDGIKTDPEKLKIFLDWPVTCFELRVMLAP